VLDLFAGSGALGLEALSRGAASVDFVDIGPRSIAALKRISSRSRGEKLRGCTGADALRYASLGSLPLLATSRLADTAYTHRDGGTEPVRHLPRTPFAAILAVEPARAPTWRRSSPGGNGDTAITFC
jgi:16S rRNA (guanine966-N2)-methyltransferase